MEALKSSSPSYLKIFSLNSPFTSGFPTEAWKKKNQIRYNGLGSNIFYRNSSFPIHLPLSKKRNFPVFSQFGRTTSRRNTLRKKLMEEHKRQVRHIPSPLNPGSDIHHSNPDIDNIQKLNENIDSENGIHSDLSSTELNSRTLGESALFNQLESWVEQYKKDTEFWGIGSGPIFTVFMSSDGNVERVSVNMDEILRRSCIEKGYLEDSAGVNVKILEAENLAREMENGNRVLPRNSSVAKFVFRGEDLSFFKVIRSFSLSPKVVEEVPRVGIMLSYGLVAVWALRKLFDFGHRKVKLTESEKEMMRRKIKSRKKKEVLEKGSVEVVQEPLKQPMFPSEKPRLNKQELMKDIARAKTVARNLVLADSSISKAAKSEKFDDKIQKIRRMAREAREIEGGKNDLVKKDGVEEVIMSKEACEGTQEGREEREEVTKFPTHLLNGDGRQTSSDNGNGRGSMLDEDFTGNGNITSHIERSDVRPTTVEDLNSNDIVEHLTHDTTSGESCVFGGSSVEEKPQIIRSVKEARIYLSVKHQNQELKQDKFFANGSGKPKAHEEGKDNIQKQQISLDNEGEGDNSEIGLSGEENWNENNVNEQIAKKIGVGFRDNYMVARKKNNQQPAVSSSMAELVSIGDDELDWMKDDHLAEIVFRVRENELAGRDPFHQMDAKDKDAFFKGLEKKVEIQNEKLSALHEWLHSNIENLDYGADGISLYDPPEKIIPRWKGPVLDKSPEFLNNFQEQRKAIFAENTGISNDLKKDELSFLQKPTESSADENISTSSAVKDSKKKLGWRQEGSKTIIEGSDGSVKAGKKSGKEFWQHTKKWSRGFLESYNAETDPEIKSIMKDMGTDLDRWITEKEIQEAANLMDKLPEESKEFMENKLSKLKREMELFGPHLVVSKYREYADDKEEDHLWWLDLPHILCIELYTVEDGEQIIGIYSLEMATDLEIEPKPHHVIAFEDANDCKNLCYIIQAQMELLGNGHAFVVAQLPKNAFREAKENGLNVTVIRKGELQLNVDQTLDEVEEQISEIGSKMYHDMIMKERSVDTSSLMKGVFGLKSKPSRTKRKKSKKMLKKREKK